MKERMKVFFNDGWEFLKQPFGTALEEGKSKEFKRVNIPHDWLIYQTADLYESATVFYRKRFSFTKREGDSKRYELYFDGVYMDSTVYLNGKEIGQWKYGYSSFFFDITDDLIDGENEIYVKIDHRSPNTRWYSGSGIYRNVYLIDYPETHIATDSLYLSAAPVSELDGDWELTASAAVEGDKREGLRLDVEIKGLEVSTEVLKAEGEFDVTTKAVVKKPELWRLVTPALYDVDIILKDEAGNELDRSSVRYGFRQFRFDHNKGLFVNGVHTKVQGVCEHHDLGAIGAAFNKAAMRRKLEILRTMGVNAVRTAHNMPDPALLELTDEMGFLVMNEAFDMWECPKTDYDYARFFKDWAKTDVKSWIRRDRNHPCIFLWSIGNEIYDTHKDAHGQEITEMLRSEARKYDPLENAAIGIGSNYMPWEGAQKCADIVKFAGYNYAERLYEEHHKQHPDWYIFGSETSSTVQSRGVYHFPYSNQILSDEDLQCSCLGNCTTGWGAPRTEYCINAEKKYDFSIGQFIWTGFDYIGEPTPYHTRNSYFGQIDTAGFPKDTYYLYRSGWTDYKTDPIVHIFPYWDFNPGQEVDVRVASNAPTVELWLNGNSLGRQDIDHAGGELTANYKVVYTPGELTAKAYDENGNEVASDKVASFKDTASIRMTVYEPERKLCAGIGDMAFIALEAIDEDGRVVENANDLVKVKVEGAGWLAGLDNGDSTDEDEYKGYLKRFFSGKLLILVAVGEKKGDIRVSAECRDTSGAEVTLHVEDEVKVEGLSLIPEVYDEKQAEETFAKEPVRIRKIQLSTESSGQLDADHKTAVIKAEIFPKNAEASELIWKAVNDDSIESNLALIKKEDENTVTITAAGDGDFRLRCMTRNGSEPVKVISQLIFKAEGIGTAYLDPYSLVAGGLWSYNEGKVGNGIEHGVAVINGERTVIGYENIDFGPFGSDEVTLPVFCISERPYKIELWEGIPDKEGSSKLLDAMYDKERIWNVYQPETYKLSRRLKGVTNIYIVFYDSAHLGGFCFKKLEKAYEELAAGECDTVYGDRFERSGSSITNIGNNVTIEFKDMDFTSAAAEKLSIKGSTPNSVNTIHVIFVKDGVETRDILEFTKDGGEVQTFDVSHYTGCGTVRFVFLPGSDFDFESFRFTGK